VPGAIGHVPPRGAMPRAPRRARAAGRSCVWLRL
jgi:hypothetical protein